MITVIIIMLHHAIVIIHNLLHARRVGYAYVMKGEYAQAVECYEAGLQHATTIRISDISYNMGCGDRWHVPFIWWWSSSDGAGVRAVRAGSRSRSSGGRKRPWQATRERSPPIPRISHRLTHWVRPWPWWKQEKDVVSDRWPTGNLLLKRGKVEEAHYYFKKVLAISPDFAPGLYSQALAYQAQVRLTALRLSTHACG